MSAARGRRLGAVRRPRGRARTRGLVAAWLSLPVLTAAFSVGGATATTRSEVRAKLDTAAFAVYRERERLRDTLVLQAVGEIRSDVRMLVCERYARQPRCLTSAAR